MKYFLLLGGFLGFLLAFSASVAGGDTPSAALLTGSAGCLAGALLFRGLHFVFSACLRSHLEERAAQIQAETNPAPAEPHRTS
jgi:hypothetical protein